MLWAVVVVVQIQDGMMIMMLTITAARHKIMLSQVLGNMTTMG